jgi:predicted transcriptional regulator
MVKTGVNCGHLLGHGMLQWVKMRVICDHLAGAGLHSLTVVSHARKTLRVSTTARISQIPAVSSKDAIGVITDIRHI